MKLYEIEKSDIKKYGSAKKQFKRALILLEAMIFYWMLLTLEAVQKNALMNIWKTILFFAHGMIFIQCKK